MTIPAGPLRENIKNLKIMNIFVLMEIWRTQRILNKL